MPRDAAGWPRVFAKAKYWNGEFAMERFCPIAFIIVLAFIRRVSCEKPAFPIGFILGAGTSNVQSEGAWNVSDKSESILDHFAHYHQEIIVDASNDDIADDSYHKYKEDVQLVRNIKFDAYRIAISWSRLLPNGSADYISADGLAYYKNFVEELNANGIKPIVTLYHMDHPQSVDAAGGWFNERTIDLFADYARVIFTELGPMVDTFVTFNEPQIQCKGTRALFYTAGSSAVELARKHGIYSCMHSILKAHAKVWHMYNQEFRPRQKGKIGLVEGCYWYRPQNASSPDDLLAAEYGFQFTCGWSMHSIYIGDYPPAMKTRVAEMSRLRGFPESQLPSFTDEEIQRIKGTSDFFGLNYYHVAIARFQTPEEEAKEPSEYGSHQTMIVQKDVVAPGLRSLLRRIRDDYGNPTVFITENGYATNGTVIEDVDRIAYFHDILTNVLRAIREDGCKVVGYLVWTLLDAWEFQSGYTLRYGLYSVDFDSPNRTRTPKWSVSWWKKVMESRQLQPVFTPNDNASTTHHESSADIRKNLSLGILCAIVLFLQL